jgi:hypothetical protein
MRNLEVWCFTAMQGLDRSYASASDNAGLIIRIPEYVSPKQWEYILEAFCKNDQIL